MNIVAFFTIRQLIFLSLATLAVFTRRFAIARHFHSPFSESGGRDQLTAPGGLELSVLENLSLSTTAISIKQRTIRVAIITINDIF